MNDIVIKGARVNNLKNIDVSIPRARFVVVTGISGSGKSSLAFDTLYAEGQRRYAQSLSSYARQFLGRMSKPDVDIIEGIPPAIAIEQKVNTRNPRSTVATTTEIYDYLRLLFARVGHTFSPVSGQEVHRDSIPEVVEFITKAQGYVYILSDMQWSAREDKVELLLSLKELGYNRLYADGKPLRIEEVLQSEDDAWPGDAWLLVDRASAPFDRDRVIASVSDAFSRGDGRMAVVSSGQAGPCRPEEIPGQAGDDGKSGMTFRQFSNRFELDGITFREPDEYLFSFNSPLGACPVCGGLGKIIGVSEDLVIPDKSLSLYDGAIACWRGEKMGWFKDHLVEVSGKYGIPIFEPYCKLSQEIKDLVWKGDPAAEGQNYDDDPTRLIGIQEFFDWVETQRYKIQYKYMLSRFSGRTTCHACGGSRLRPEALWVKVGGKTIHDLLSMDVDTLLEFFAGLDLPENDREIAQEPLSEIVSRLEYIQEVGLGYLTLSRACNTLSGGESQRINLVTALGSSLVGSMYILDEPSIGLHPRDTERLIGVLRHLRDMGNTVVVVEHDEEIIRAADVVIDMGPKAGINGGEIVFRGSLKNGIPADHGRSLTLDYLSGARKRYMREKRGWNYSIKLEGVMEHNLKGMDVKFPLGVLNVVTGVSGSGKSSLVGDILYPAMFRRLNDTGDLPGTFRGMSGNLDRITRVEYVDQNPIGKSSRSNAVTYLKIYDDIRKLLAEQQYARLNGFGPSHFSFNQEGGRCPECQGEGVVKIEMQFMADVTMVCEACGGKRFKPEILEVRYRGKNIDDILNMSVDDAMEFFGQGREAYAASIVRKLKTLSDVGLGYIKLGQSSSTLSGGESQRIKLAYFLAMSGESGISEREKIMFIFDEPTTGLHFYDVEKLLKAFDVLLAKGHSLVVVEHNMDVIRNADWVIDLGPDAGDQGGEVVFEGTPEQLVKEGKTFTAKYLKEQWMQ